MQVLKATFVLLSIFLIWPLHLFAAYAFVNQVSAGGSGNSVTTGAVDMTGVDLLVACGSYQAGVTMTMTDSTGSNTWTPRTLQTVNANEVRLWYVQNPTVSASQTFTLSGTGSAPSVTVMGFSGSAATPADQENGTASAGPTSLQPGSITPTEDNEVIAACLSFSQSNTIAIDSGFSTVYQTDFAGGSHYGVAGAYLIQTTAAAVNPSFSWSTGADAAATQSSFKAAAAGGGGTGFTTQRGIVRP